MEKKKKISKQPVLALPEKHPLERLPVEPEKSAISEEDLDKIPDEEMEEIIPAEEPPEPGEGP